MPQDRIFTIILEIDAQSKKNRYRITKTGKFYKPKEIVDTEKLAFSQIPPEYYGLNLRHPAIEFWAEMPKKNWALDIDGLYTTIADLLVRFQVIKDDRIRDCNGPKLLHPVIEGPRKKFTIKLHENGKLPITSF